VPGEGPVGLPTPEVQAPDIPTPVVPGPEDPENTVGFPDSFPTPEVSAPDEPFLPTPSLPEEENPRILPDTAARDMLNADMSVPWPGVSEQLRERFRTAPAQELMLGDDHVYIRAPMPEGSGYEHVEIGIQATDGVPTSVAYALPSRFTPEPPPGLEDYEWKGGASEGWWVVYTDPETGAPFA